MLDPDGELDDIVAEMETAAAEVATGEITTATRDVELDGVQVQLGMSSGWPTARSAALTRISARSSRTLAHGDRGPRIADPLLRCGYVGSGCGWNGKPIQGWHAHLEVEVVDGGQPHYFYIISAE